MAEYRRTTRAVTSNYYQSSPSNLRAGNAQQQLNATVEKQEQQTPLPPPPPVPPLLTSPAVNADEVVQNVSDTAQNVSATTKALDAQDIPKWRRSGVRVPNAIKRRKVNARLSRIVAPKNAMLVLHEMQPGVSYQVKPATAGMGCVAPFIAEAILDGKVLGTGTANSKVHAKNAAAEVAIKKIISGIMKKTLKPEAKATTAPAGDAATADEPEAMDQQSADEPEAMDQQSADEPSFPWAGVASYAMFKLLNDWHADGVEVPIKNFILPREVPIPPTAASAVKAPSDARAPQPKQGLPPNAESMHPTSLLIYMRPGLILKEIARTAGPGSPGTVTVSCEIDNVTYTGTSSCRKKARMETAKVALKALYGVVFPPEPKKTVAAEGNK